MARSCYSSIFCRVPLCMPGFRVVGGDKAGGSGGFDTAVSAEGVVSHISLESSGMVSLSVFSWIFRMELD